MAADKMSLMRRINEVSFAMDDTRLYLDTHNNCSDALKYYKDLCAVREKLVDEYTAAYGPLCWYGCANKTDWTWAEQPWPWEGECR